MSGVKGIKEEKDITMFWCVVVGGRRIEEKAKLMERNLREMEARVGW